MLIMDGSKMWNNENIASSIKLRLFMMRWEIGETELSSWRPDVAV